MSGNKDFIQFFFGLIHSDIFLVVPAKRTPIVPCSFTAIGIALRANPTYLAFHDDWGIDFHFPPIDTTDAPVFQFSKEEVKLRG